MCGIAGLYARSGRVDHERMQRMSHLLRHRGPDDEGLALIESRTARVLTLGGPDTPLEVLASRLRHSPGHWVQPGPAPAATGMPTAARFDVGLVHRRLSIVDLSVAGHQPMCDAEGELWITYNGDVYNHVELRAELEGLGERIAGASDTAVILAAWRRFGRDALPRLNGMFAFALWDGRARELVLVRDRFGVKPLYYQWEGDTLAFASEPKAVVLTQESRPAPRLQAVRDLIALDWVDHGTGTFFEGLQSLPAGHYLAIGERGAELRAWWRLDPDARATGTPAEWEREFARLFDDAVAIRLRADVEVGSCLSGGLDSSAVVTTAARHAGRPIHTFTCAYDEGPEYDERPFARTVAEASGAASHLTVPDGGDFWSVFDRLAASQDEPTAGPGLYSQWKVMELAHQNGLKVLLDGQGADETLAGYWRYLPIRLRDLLSEGHFGSFRRLLGPVSERLGFSTTLALALEPWLPAGMVAPLRRRFGAGKDRVMTGGLRAVAEDPRHPRPRPPAAARSALSRQLAFDTLQRLLPSLLRYEDRNSMAFSIETRLPFLDYRLVEFAFALPDEQKLDGVTTKSILRRALADRIPPAVLARRDKMGFETPADVWLRGRYAGEVRRRLLDQGPIHEWLDPTGIERALREWQAGRPGLGLQVWRWLSLEAWSRRYLVVDPRHVGAPPAVRALGGTWSSEFGARRASRFRPAVPVNG